MAWCASVESSGCAGIRPRDSHTIREKFDTYRFADHKERVITLLARVARVSVETVQLVEALKAGPR